MITKKEFDIIEVQYHVHLLRVVEQGCLNAINGIYSCNSKEMKELKKISVERYNL